MRRSFSSAASRRFTLLELLVVVTIIIILAGLFMPGAMRAIGAARGTECQNNLKQVMTAGMLYAMDYGGAQPLGISRYHINGRQTDLTWSRYLTGGVERYPVNRNYLDKNACIRCPDGEFSANDNMQAHTYGMFFYDVKTPDESLEFPGMPFSQWGRADGENAFMLSSRLRSPGAFILYADTMVNADRKYQFYKFNPRRFIKNSDDKPIGMVPRHGSCANIGFGDGHAKALDEGGMHTAGVICVIETSGRKKYLE